MKVTRRGNLYHIRYNFVNYNITISYIYCKFTDANKKNKYTDRKKSKGQFKATYKTTIVK